MEETVRFCPRCAKNDSGLTTNVPAMPFDFVDFDVKLSDKRQKFYRVRQP